ncbi:WD40-repeat-containing domain protein, partial [Circinella umbellata]
LATGQYVHVYKIDHFGAAFRGPLRTLTTPIPRQGQDLGMDTINQLKVGRIFDEEVVVTVSDAGDIWIWRTGALDEPPMTINNDNSSTWGLAIHGDQGLIAVSANSWTITVYNMAELTKNNPIFGKRRRNLPPVMKGIEKRELSGHTDNIPCVDFNQTGQYVASCSIDQTCRLWDIKTGQQATIRKIEMSRRENE